MALFPWKGSMPLFAYQPIKSIILSRLLVLRIGLANSTPTKPIFLMKARPWDGSKEGKCSMCIINASQFVTSCFRVSRPDVVKCFLRLQWPLRNPAYWRGLFLFFYMLTLNLFRSKFLSVWFVSLGQMVASCQWPYRIWYWYFDHLETWNQSSKINWCRSINAVLS